MAFEGLTEKLQGALRKLSSKGKLTEDNVKEGMREVRMALLEADVNYAVAKDFIKKVTARCVGTEITGTLSASQQVIKIVNEEMTQLMGGENARLTWSSGPLTVYMLCGLQGAGKTTMAAKLANYLAKQGKKPMLAACDIYRPAAINQLQVVGKQVNVPVYEHGTQDPVKTALEAVERARYLGRDVLIIDTAGRLHIDQELMDELVRIKENVHPQEILLVVDAMTGQDAVNVAQTFNEKLDIDGVILTKLDGDTRGGAALSVLAVTGKSLDDILDLNLQHDVHTALQVQTQIQLLLLALLVGELAESHVEDRHVLDRIQIVLFGTGLLLERELCGILGRLFLYASCLERKRELINTRERQKHRDEFNETFALHLREKNLLLFVCFVCNYHGYAQ